MSGDRLQLSKGPMKEIPLREEDREIKGILVNIVARCKTCQWSRVSDNAPDDTLSVDEVIVKARQHAIDMGHVVGTQCTYAVTRETRS